MQLIEKQWQSRRDFSGVYRCENCGYEEALRGYDDRNFHDNIVPTIPCKKCGKSSEMLGTPLVIQPTKYADGEVV